jgi:hypothetical protein
MAKMGCIEVNNYLAGIPVGLVGQFLDEFFLYRHGQVRRCRCLLRWPVHLMRFLGPDENVNWALQWVTSFLGYL